jgi:hypothetical protein
VGSGSPRAVTRALAALFAGALLIAGSTAHAEGERPHSLAFKLGYHVYPNSSYFKAFQGLSTGSAGGAQDFNGPSMELFDYTYQWPSRWSINVSFLGLYYQTFLPNQTSKHSLLVHTMTATPVYRFMGSDAVGAWQVYGGVGVGRYGLTARFDFQNTGTTTEFDTYTLGYQALIGAEYRLNEQAGLLIEEKFSRARIRFSQTELVGREIDVGGHNILVGARIHF